MSDRPGRSSGALTRHDLGGPALVVARSLLGSLLTSTVGGHEVTVCITEVEAYGAQDDPGSHAFRGRSERNAVMFGEAGHLYVYRHLGLHHCLNVATGPAGSASAVLLRAGEVIVGAEVARGRREARGVVRADVDLARGPARLAVALGIDATMNGVDLLDPHGALRLGPGVPTGEIAWGPRVGVSGDGGRGDLFPWRLWVAGEPTVSAYRRAPARPRRTRGSGTPSGTAH
ncbi:MAG: DNA-3-methyladenine glycosylase [Cellulomonadaceae bacterium]|nr:DNA-3-methyladenine glycosylase [Cellulomonadaceae bacterium]